MSTTVTSLPRSARHAAVVSPTYPAPITATLLIPAELSQQAFVGRDRRPRRLAPAELARAVDARLPRSLRLSRQARCSVPKRVGVAVIHQLARAVDDLREARVAVRRHRASARQ